MNSRTMADALLAASAAAQRWPRWKMGLDEVPGHREPLEVANRWMGVRVPKHGKNVGPVSAFIISGYKDRYGSYYVDLWRQPWVLARNLRKWAHELAKPITNTRRLAMAEALSEAQAILEMPDMPDGAAILGSKACIAQAYKRLIMNRCHWCGQPADDDEAACEECKSLFACAPQEED